MAKSGHKLSNPVFHEPVVQQGAAGQPIFGEPQTSADPLGFDTPHPSDNAVYKEIDALLKKAVVACPRSRGELDDLYALETAYGDRGADVVAAIKKAGRIVFHTVGDTGSSSERKYRNELLVADQLSLDCQSDETRNRPAFMFHLGDVIYNFGEAAFYFDQFYEPYRAYAGPIFALAGNHDSFVVPGTAPEDRPLVTFERNFCAQTPVVSADAGGLHRTAMTQPGVYFALDAPFVRIIGLFTNALEDPGVISSEDGRWPNVTDIQLDFLRAQLRLAKTQAYAGALIIATHHPPFAYSPPPDSSAVSGYHSSSPAVIAEIDRICVDEGVYPHAVFSAHVHNYQRYTRTIEFDGGEREVPFVICGNGGHNVNPLSRGTRKHPAQEPENESHVDYLDESAVVTSKGLVLEKYDDHDYGYMRVSVDDKELRIAYHQAGARSLLQSRYDLVTVDLATHRLSANKSRVPATS